MVQENIETEIDLSDDKSEKIEKAEKQNSSSKEDDLQIEVVDDTPPQDRNRPKRAANAKSSVPEDEEIANYSKGVQDRIRQMKWEYHEERRQKEAWQREHTAAVDLTKRMFDENKKLRKMITEGHKTLLDTTKQSVESELAALQESLKAATESGNSALAAELQVKISKAAARAEAQSNQRPISFDEEEEPKTKQPVQQRQQVQLSGTMQDWMKENPWFNTNKRMTALAFGVHEDLLEKGIPVESPRYFSEINKAVREAFPTYFEEDDEQQVNGKTSEKPAARRQTVAGVHRAPATGSRTRVTLTDSEVRLAKRMGLTVEQYAREKQRLTETDNG